ncbi:MAG: phage portal protein, partial [Desulfovibrio sp.]|nr:phage portal protein [Desulfovibrio sp.]
SMEINPGTIVFGEPNEKPYVLENTRPSSNFVPFVSTILRAASAMLGIPYESLTKDYSSTNYSSMRAALNEAWKLYLFYRRWFARLYCQPLWEMVVEEAYLRNFLGLADDLDSAGAGMGFYEGRRYWCSAEWIGPAKGFIDPVKEIEATVMALQARLMTYADAWAERGGDFADALPQMQEEQAMLKDLLPLGAPSRKNSSIDDKAGEGADDA